MHYKVMGRARTGFTEVFAQSLSADSDFDPGRNDMVFSLDRLSCHDDHLCQLIFASRYAYQSYGSDTNKSH